MGISSMPKKLPTYWIPQKGPQTLAAICPCDTIFFGGTRGSSKSDCAIGRQIRGAVKYGQYWNGLFIRRKYKDLAEVRRRFDGLINHGMPAERIGGDKDTNHIRFKNGANITLTAIQHVDQISDWQGHQFSEVSIDEAPTFPYIVRLIDELKATLRSPYGVPCHMFLTGNPGGAGAADIKLLFINDDPNGEGKVITEEYENPLTGEIEYSTRTFIRSTVYDNKILVENDPRYVAKLLSIKDPRLRAAWLEGRWDVFIGQAFDFDPNRHIV